MFFGIRFLSVSISRRVTKPARGTYLPRVFSFSNMAAAGEKSLGTRPGTRLIFGTGQNSKEKVGTLVDFPRLPLHKVENR